MKSAQSVEERLEELIREYKLSGRLSVEKVKEWIWNDEGESSMDASNRYQKKWFPHFSKAKDSDFNRILQVFTDAWNYFPHKSLGGKSPEQKFRELYGESPPEKPTKEAMPEVIVGGRKMPWEAYQAMLQAMEETQRPFREWVDNTLLPQYVQFLASKYKEQTRKKHQEVAEIFFDRAMWLGFVELKELRKDFIQIDFPRWWQTHVLDSTLNEQGVRSSLGTLFQFIAEEYDIIIKR